MPQLAVRFNHQQATGLYLVDLCPGVAALTLPTHQPNLKSVSHMFVRLLKYSLLIVRNLTKPLSHESTRAGRPGHSVLNWSQRSISLSSLLLFPSPSPPLSPLLSFRNCPCNPPTNSGHYTTILMTLPAFGHCVFAEFWLQIFVNNAN